MKVLDRFEETFITFLMGGATLLIFVAVVHRYAAGWPIPGVQDCLLKLDLSWAQELCIIMFVWMAKFGAAYGVRTGIHVGVDVLINRLDDSKRSKMIIFGLGAGALFTGIVATLGGHFVWENGAHYAFFKLFGANVTEMFPGPTTPDLEIVDVDRLFGDPTRFVADVLSLPAGARGVYPDGRAAASRSWPRGGARGRVAAAGRGGRGLSAGRQSASARSAPRPDRRRTRPRRRQADREREASARRLSQAHLGGQGDEAMNTAIIFALLVV